MNKSINTTALKSCTLDKTSAVHFSVRLFRRGDQTYTPNDPHVGKVHLQSLYLVKDAKMHYKAFQVSLYSIGPIGKEFFSPVLFRQ